MTQNWKGELYLGHITLWQSGTRNQIYEEVGIFSVHKILNGEGYKDKAINLFKISIKWFCQVGLHYWG